MPYQFLPDALPIVPMALHDTVKVYVLKEGFSWDKTLSAIVGLIAVIVAMVGWGVNSYLARKNQKKSSDESVLDKIRTDLIPLFNEHREWVLEFREIVNELTKLNAIYEFNAIEGNPTVDPNQPEAKFYKQPLGFSEIKPFLEKKNTRKWITRLIDYQDLFKPMIPVLELLDYEHISIRNEIRDFINNYNNVIPNYIATTKILNKTTIRLENLAGLRDQFFRYFQYECLRSIGRIKAPHIKASIWQDKIIRESDESYRLEISEEKKLKLETDYNEQEWLRLASTSTPQGGQP